MRVSIFFKELENEFYNLCQRGVTNWRDLANFRDSSYKTDSLIRSSTFNIDKFIDFRDSENPKYFAKVLRFNFMAHIFVSRIKSKAYQVCNKKLLQRIRNSLFFDLQFLFNKMKDTVKFDPLTREKFKKVKIRPKNFHDLERHDRM